MRVSLVAAVARNRTIGVRGELPWRLPDDMAWFKRWTMGHHVLMGRTTWTSLRKPLVGRENLVLTRDPSLIAPGATVFTSLEAAMAHAERAGETELMIIGGAELYALTLPLADRLYLTRVHADVPGDRTFPILDANWEETSREEHPADARHAFSFALCVLERVPRERQRT